MERESRERCNVTLEIEVRTKLVVSLGQPRVESVDFGGREREQRSWHLPLVSCSEDPVTRDPDRSAVDDGATAGARY